MMTTNQHTTSYLASDMSIAAVEARSLSRYSSLTGEERRKTVEYMEGVGFGRWGTVSQGGRDYAKRVLDAMAD